MMKKLANKLIERLSEEGIEAYIYTVAETTNSIYIRFKNERFRSIRLSDHTGYSRYQYKWNVRSDIKKSYKKFENNVLRFYYTPNDIELLIEDLKKRREQIKKWDKEDSCPFPYKKKPTFEWLQKNKNVRV